MRVPKPLMPEKEAGANGNAEKQDEELQVPLASVSLDSPEVD
jgi:hypothetical protein